MKLFKLYPSFFLFLILFSSCNKSMEDFNKITSFKKSESRPINTVLGTTSYEDASRICNDEVGNIYFTNSGSEIIKITPGATQEINTGYSCFRMYYANPFTVYNGKLTGMGYIGTNPVYTQTVQTSSSSPSTCSSSTYVDHNINLGIIPAIHTNYNGGVYAIHENYEVYYKPSNSNVFSKTALVARDLACSANGGLYYITSNNQVYFKPANFVEVPGILGNINAVKVAVDKVTGSVYCIDGANKPRYFSGQVTNGTWSGTWEYFPTNPSNNCWDICAHNNMVYAIGTNQVFYFQRGNYVVKYWGTVSHY